MLEWRRENGREVASVAAATAEEFDEQGRQQGTARGGDQHRFHGLVTDVLDAGALQVAALCFRSVIFLPAAFTALAA